MVFKSDFEICEDYIGKVYCQEFDKLEVSKWKSNAMLIHEMRQLQVILDQSRENEELVSKEKNKQAERQLRDKENQIENLKRYN